MFAGVRAAKSKSPGRLAFEGGAKNQGSCGDTHGLTTRKDLLMCRMRRRSLICGGVLALCTRVACVRSSSRNAGVGREPRGGGAAVAQPTTVAWAPSEPPQTATALADLRRLTTSAIRCTAKLTSPAVVDRPSPNRTASRTRASPIPIARRT